MKKTVCIVSMLAAAVAFGDSAVKPSPNYAVTTSSMVAVTWKTTPGEYVARVQIVNGNPCSTSEGLYYQKPHGDMVAIRHICVEVVK